MINKILEHDTDSYVNEKRVAEITGFALQTLRNARAVGKLFPYIKIGKSVRYRLGDIIAIMEKNKIDIS